MFLIWFGIISFLKDLFHSLTNSFTHSFTNRAFTVLSGSIVKLFMSIQHVPRLYFERGKGLIHLHRCQKYTKQFMKSEIIINCHNMFEISHPNTGQNPRAHIHTTPHSPTILIQPDQFLSKITAYSNLSISPFKNSSLPIFINPYKCAWGGGNSFLTSARNT
jgi:hypothetical protein